MALARQALLTIRHDKKNDYERILRVADNDLAGAESELLVAFFRIHLAKIGASRTLDRLEGLKNVLKKEDYVRIGSGTSSAIGDYQRQERYLDVLQSEKYGWVERERVKCLIATSRFEEASNHVVHLISLDQKFYSEFCLNVLWQFNKWNELSFLLQYIENANLKRYVDFSRKIRRAGNAQSARVYSVYTGMSRNQLAFQQESFRASGIELSPAMGVTVDRFPIGALKALGGDKFSPGIIGASLGHLKAMEDFVGTGAPYCFITESDAYLSKVIDFHFFDGLFKSGRFDFVLCADRHAELAAEQIRNDVETYQYSGRASGFDGYALSRESAQAILNATSAPYAEHIDGRVIEWLANTAKAKIGVVTEPIFAQSMLSVFSVRTALELNY